MYVTPNFKTKKALREAVANGETVTAWQPGPFASTAPTNGAAFAEGPHYPEPHRWYANIVLRDGLVVGVK